MMKPLLAIGVGALGLGGLFLAEGARPFDAGARPLPAVPAALQQQAGTMAVDCGEGRHALVQQANGLTSVQCAVTLSPLEAPSAGDGMLVSGPLPVPLARPVVTDTVAPRPLRVSSAPAYRTYDGGQRRTVRRGRSWKKSAAIIGGSTAAGAGVGAVLGGGSGAKKGAVVGLLGGTIYDLATRTH